MTRIPKELVRNDRPIVCSVNIFQLLGIRSSPARVVYSASNRVVCRVSLFWNRREGTAPPLNRHNHSRVSFSCSLVTTEKPEFPADAGFSRIDAKDGFRHSFVHVSIEPGVSTSLLLACVRNHDGIGTCEHSGIKIQIPLLKTSAICFLRTTWPNLHQQDCRYYLWYACHVVRTNVSRSLK
jgi:hypothetical protein